MIDEIPLNVGQREALFGIPLGLPSDECSVLLDALQNLWRTLYGREPASLIADVAACRLYFDPVARGHRLREMLAALEPLEGRHHETLVRIGEPLVIEAGDGVLLTGLEGRLAIAVLSQSFHEFGTYSPQPTLVHDAQMYALETYRAWTQHRIVQVLALRQGKGKEVLQATSVGVVLTLLVNRSTSPERAIGRIVEDSVRRRIDRAIHAAAGAFADRVAGESDRSEGEQRLIGGHWLSEARRRLAHRLVVTKTEPSYVFIPEEHQAATIEFLGRELARRSSMRRGQIEEGFDALVRSFRAAATTLAGQGMVFERPADTARLRLKLVESFDAFRSENEEK